MWFNQNVTGMEAIQNGAFQSPECKRGRCGKPESDLDMVVECGIFLVDFNIVHGPIGNKVGRAKNIVTFAGFNGKGGIVAFR